MVYLPNDFDEPLSAICTYNLQRELELRSELGHRLLGCLVDERPGVLQDICEIICVLERIS